MKRNFFNKIKIDINSTLPIIINNINIIFEKELIFWNSKFSTPYKPEFTVFIIVKIPNLNDDIKSILFKVNNDDITKRDSINNNIAKKYFVISDRFIFLSKKLILFVKICLGLVWERSSLIENFVKLNNLKNLKPELVEKKEPPIITKIKNIMSSLLEDLSK